MAFLMSERMEDRAVVSGNDAIAYMIFPDGRRKVLANMLSCDARQTYTKTKYPILGKRTKPAKKGQGEITGTMKLHYNTSVFREAALEYQKTGQDSFYDIQLVNEDPNSGVGRQTVILYGLNFDEMPLALIDAEADYLTEDLPFTANSWDLENIFGDGGLIDA